VRLIIDGPYLRLLVGADDRFVDVDWSVTSCLRGMTRVGVLL